MHTYICTYLCMHCKWHVACLPWLKQKLRHKWGAMYRMSDVKLGGQGLWSLTDLLLGSSQNVVGYELSQSRDNFRTLNRWTLTEVGPSVSTSYIDRRSCSGRQENAWTVYILASMSTECGFAINLLLSSLVHSVIVCTAADLLYMDMNITEF